MSEIIRGDGVPIVDKQQNTDVVSFLKPILDKQLTVDEIDNYAFIAVDGLVSLINQKVGEYKLTHNTADWDDKTVEDKALEFYDLEDVGTYLDFLDKKDEEIRNLDRVIKRIVHQDKVIIPPSETKLPIIKFGNGEGIEDKKIINRTKAVLFILKEDFNVDIDDEEQLILVDGVIKGNIMRDTSYVLIKAPIIGRTILVCDEEGNASYVINNEVLEKQNISNEELIDFTKTDLNTLITERPELGKRVVYSKTGFVPRIIDAIKKPDFTRPDEVTENMKDTGKYLYPKASENELSCCGLAKKIGGISEVTIADIIKQIDPEELGEVIKRKFGAKTVDSYTQKQQEIIIKKGEELGIIAPLPEKGELSCRGLAEKIGKISNKTIADIIKQIDPEELGEVKKMKFGKHITAAYTLEQQETIIKKSEELGIIAPLPEKNELSCYGLAEKIGKISNKTIADIIKQIDPEELGEVIKRKFGPKITTAYNLKQQDVIKKYVDKWRKKKK